MRGAEDMISRSRVTRRSWAPRNSVRMRARTGLAESKISPDSLYGIAFSPEADRLAFGCADKTVRMIRVKDGQELMKFDNHSDWVLATTFSLDGKRLLSGSRDRAMKLIDAGFLLREDLPAVIERGEREWDEFAGR